ncbi:hypothetical protein [Microbulbifer rhizosphaerae]|uniref:AhpC/TSA family protein n=1 Tax=Microbulbifer rhizosphaerae TaxID=1562603 RepID=A0A7W4WEX4_9GAMM|nr:hypothetical protein [Microbulbifer rhizosphaerae]MBB3062316.1 hypothetical protein [Microbulbifer rhizosphaerae]
MNKFKSFFTFLAFIWLYSCGFWALFRWISVGGIAWLGLAVNALALPVWMILRLWRPARYRGSLREDPAFAAVLLGLAVVLVTDTGKGEPAYLAIYNLFILLAYLFHLSALRQPEMPGVNERFPPLCTVEGQRLDPAAGVREGNIEGLVLVFLRGTFCADSRALLSKLPELGELLNHYNAQLILFSTEDKRRWAHLWRGGQLPEIVQLAEEEEANRPFVAAGGQPLWQRLFRPSTPTAGVCRPGLWLLDGEGFVLWRHLPGNYRTPGDVDLLKGQLSRLGE